MSFAAPGWLLLGLLGAVVVMLHIRRRTVIEVSSLELWKRFAAPQKRRAAWHLPKLSLPLILQLLAVFLVALALAQPRVGSAAALPDHQVFVLDTSGSMNTLDNTLDGEVTRLERALAYLEDDLAAAGDVQVVSVLAVGPDVDFIAARLGPQGALKMLSDVRPSDAAASRQNWEEVARAVAGLNVGDESLHLTILTDGAGAESVESTVAAALPGIPLELIGFGKGAANAALEEAYTTRLDALDAETQRWAVEGKVRVFSDEPQPEPQPLKLSVFFTPEGTDGALPWAEAELEPENGSASFEIEVELPEAGLLEVRLPDDALAFDNQKSFLLGPAPRSVRVLQVGPSNPPLERALESVGGLELSRADALPESSDAFDLVILDRVGVARHPGTHTLFLGGASLGGDAPPSLRDATPTSWRSSHPLSRPVDWSVLEPGSAFEVDRLPGSVVLLEASGEPLVQARSTGVGREVIVAFDVTDSSWTEEPGFPMFMANLVDWVAPWRTETTGKRCTVGRACPLEPRILYEGATLVPLTLPGEPVILPSPFVREEGLSPEAAWIQEDSENLYYPRRAGAYRIESRGEMLFVDALVGEESDVRAAGGGDGAVENGRRQVWPAHRWLLLILLAILVTEALVAGRGTDRFLQRRALDQASPLARRHRLVLGLRVLTLGLTLMAALGLSFLQPYREGRFVLVVDQPESYPKEAQERIETSVSALMRYQGAWRKQLVQLGHPVKVLVDTEALASEGTDDGFGGENLASALDLAQAMIGESATGRIALLSSGAETQGEAASVLPTLVFRGTTVDVLPVGGVPSGEVFLRGLELPTQIYQGDSFTLSGSVYSGSATPAVLKVYRDGELLSEQELQLSPGLNRVETEFNEAEAGRFLYEYEVLAQDDVVPENNRDGVIADVQLKARVALVTPQPAWGTVLADALTLQGISVIRLEPSQAPYFLKDLLGYDTVILANVPAIDLHSQQQETLEQWVRDYGGGLVILGGENSFGPGGYYQTALERVSPLSSRVPQEAPKVVMMFVLDRSGSMQQAVDGASRLDIAKEATATAVDLLNPESTTGIVVFDTEAQTLLPLQKADGEAVRRALAPLQPGGGTALYWALISAYEQMRLVDAATRHIVVMTDGLSQPADFSSLSQRIAEEGITVSTVAIGKGIDTSILQNIARRGGGAFHVTDDFRALPSILSQEALMLSSEPLEEVVFTPQWQSREAVFLEGLPDAVPSLNGYVKTTAKPKATVHLSGPEEAPILASWRYGLGRVVAFASQGAGRWSREWISHPSYPLLWSQVVRWTLPPVVKPGLHLGLERSGDALRVRVQGVDSEGNNAEHLRIRAVLTGSTNDSNIQRSSSELAETEPGLYQGEFVIEAPGRYTVEVQADDEALEPAREDAYVSYSARYDLELHNTDRLLNLAAATRGDVILSDGDAGITGQRVPIHWRERPGWPLLALFALGLLLLELTFRYAPNLLSWRRTSPQRGRATYP